MESLKLTRDQIPAFLRAIKHNRRIAAKQSASGRYTDFDYYFVSYHNGLYTLLPPGRRDAELARSYNDYFAAALVGALPLAARHGSDGIKISPTGLITKVELKLCIKNAARFGINDNGFLTVVGSQKVKGIRSDCKACYEISKNLDSKDIDTYFILYDGNQHQLISIWKIPGSAIVRRLGKNVPKEGEKAKKLNITLSAIITEGEEVFLDFMDSVGLEAWEDSIYAQAGKTRPVALPSKTKSKVVSSRQNARWTKDMENQLLIMAEGGMTYDLLAKTFKVSKSSISNKLRRARAAQISN